MRFFEVIIGTLFPAYCLGCKKNISNQSLVLSESCRKKIIIPHTLFCGQCGARLPSAGKICHRETPYVLGSIFPYEDPLAKNMILALKFRGMRSIGSFLGKLLSEYAHEVSNQNNISLREMIVVPVPLSRERLRDRGFNQAALIAQSFAESLNLSIQKDLLVRTQHTKPQSHVRHAEKRLRNVQDVFRVPEDRNLKDKNIILVDDVTTTGATLKSAAQTLKKAGVKKILAFTVAR